MGPDPAALAAYGGNKAYVDGLFEFSHPLAYDYEGRWTAPAGGGPLARDSVFEITILQATCPGCTPMPGVATVKPKDTASIRTRAGSSPRASAPSPPLGGDYGKVVGPTIVAFVADDFDNGDAAYGSLDTLTVVFDLATDRGGLGDDAGATAAAVAMLSFSTDLGGDTVGEWTDDSTLVVTVGAASAASAGDVLVGKTTVAPRPVIRNKGCCAAYTPAGCADGTTCCCYNATSSDVVLAGDFGSLLPPAIAAFVGADPDDGDASYGASDILTISFNMATDRGKGDPFGGKAWVDDLLWFSLPIGDDYSGEWVEEDSAVRISILQPASTLSSLPEAHFACEQLHGGVVGGGVGQSMAGAGAAATAPPASPPPMLPGLATHCYEGVAPVTYLNTSVAYWRQTLVLPRGDTYDHDGDGNGGLIRNRAESSAPAGVPPVLEARSATWARRRSPPST